MNNNVFGKVINSTVIDYLNFPYLLVFS
jgi:hypothetical protein